MFDTDRFLEEYNREGYSLVENALAPGFVQRMKSELEAAIVREVEYHGTTDYRDYGMVLLCSLYGGTFIEIFDNPLVTGPMNAVMGPGCILYAYTSSSMPPGKSNYSNRVHVDTPRFVPGYETNMGIMVLLDEFTVDNGATYFLPGSHTMAQAPTDDYFYANARRVTAPAGTVCFFSAKLWHAGSINTTDKWRHALTMNVCRPYMKQRIDIPRAMAGMDTSGYSQAALQKLGFLAQTPAGYDEYYVPPEQRKFKQPYE